MSLWTCRDPECGVLNKSAATTCEQCGTERRGKPSGEATTAGKACDHCGTTTAQLNTFRSDTLVVEDRGARLCAGCWIPALRRRAEADQRVHGGRCPEPGCGKTVAQHIAEAKSIAASAEWEARFGGARG